jgi:hypothetical protein
LGVLFISLMTTCFAFGSAKTQIAGSELQRGPYIVLKVTQVVKASKKPFAVLKLRFSCEDRKYTAWLVSSRGVRTGTAELRFNNAVKVFVKLTAKSDRVLAIEDVEEDSETSFFAHLQNTKRFQIVYMNRFGKRDAAEFMVKGIYKKIAAVASACDTTVATSFTNEQVQ